ncbi:MAG: hypothetical protein EHM79_07065 [Geobacter sp.]|nr:MAG: hypothetical protein EHM79_07065 [Geobacter sp.]
MAVVEDFELPRNNLHRLALSGEVHACSKFLFLRGSANESNLSIYIIRKLQLLILKEVLSAGDARQ